jgi:hypothetical protein
MASLFAGAKSGQALGQNVSTILARAHDKRATDTAQSTADRSSPQTPGFVALQIASANLRHQHVI